MPDLHPTLTAKVEDAKRLTMSAGSLLQNGVTCADDLYLVEDDLERALKIVRDALNTQVEFEEEQA